MTKWNWLVHELTKSMCRYLISFTVRHGFSNTSLGFWALLSLGLALFQAGSPHDDKGAKGHRHISDQLSNLREHLFPRVPVKGEGSAPLEWIFMNQFQTLWTRMRTCANGTKGSVNIALSHRVWKWRKADSKKLSTKVLLSEDRSWWGKVKGFISRVDKNQISVSWSCF